MMPRNTPSEMSLCPENIAVSTTLHRTTKLARRRKKTLILGGVAGGEVVSADMGQEINGKAGSVEIMGPKSLAAAGEPSRPRTVRPASPKENRAGHGGNPGTPHAALP